ncbi:IS1595 family transposase, partial [Bacteroidales bacterium]|nr:IS1595 family transposase [Bacteroidales bacterium]
LSYYLDEYTFRHNRRKSHTRGLLFQRLIEQAVTHVPVEYKSIKSM